MLCITTLAVCSGLLRFHVEADSLLGVCRTLAIVARERRFEAEFSIV
jgi:hypothetical protein